MRWRREKKRKTSGTEKKKKKRKGSNERDSCITMATANPRLSRRWSLDNLSPAHAAASAKEGYVRDIRKQHHLAAIRDEEYPLMLTEGAAAAAAVPAAAAKRAVTPPRLLLHGRHRSGSVDVEQLKVGESFISQLRYLSRS